MKKNCCSRCPHKDQLRSEALKIYKNHNSKTSQVKQFLATNNAHTKYKRFRKSFAGLKVIAYDLDEIWSPDSPHIDKLSKQNAGIKYLLLLTVFHAIYVSNHSNENIQQQHLKFSNK